MRIVDDPERVRGWSRAYRTARLRVGLVPTMGAFHEGHVSLIRRARADCDRVIASVYVNPMQFGPGEDLGRYPRTFEADCEACRDAGVDLVFRGEDARMYPPGYLSEVQVREITDVLCGPHRPGHFRGVTTVVLKLFQITEPDVAYFGQKDYQQAVVIRRMTVDLNLPVEVRVLPTVRDSKGLALSSRNAYLSDEERHAALCIVRALREAESAYAGGERRAGEILRRAEGVIAGEPLARPEYIALVDPESLRPIDTIEKGAVLAVAIRIGGVRLIDNTLLGWELG